MVLGLLPAICCTVGFLAPVRSALAELRHPHAMAVRALRPPATAQGRSRRCINRRTVRLWTGWAGSAAIHGVWKVAGARWREEVRLRG